MLGDTTSTMVRCNNKVETIDLIIKGKFIKMINILTIKGHKGIQVNLLISLNLKMITETKIYINIRGTEVQMYYHLKLKNDFN